MSRLDEKEYKRWREEADRALRGARLQAEHGLHNWACFGAEQAAQLAVKGLLHGTERRARECDLVRLAAMLTKAGHDVPEVLGDRLRRLSRHYIAARYPHAHAAGPAASHYGAADAGQALRDADEVLRYTDEMCQSLRCGD